MYIYALATLHYHLLHGDSHLTHLSGIYNTLASHMPIAKERVEIFPQNFKKEKRKRNLGILLTWYQCDLCSREQLFFRYSRRHTIEPNNKKQ